MAGRRVRIISFIRQHWLFLILVAEIICSAFLAGYLISGPFIAGG